MDLKNLKWTKSVTPQYKKHEWAYRKFEAYEIFKLSWKDNKNNAKKPEKNDLILLRQKGYITHLVKVLDCKPKEDHWQGHFNIYRIVEILWVIDWKNLPDLYKVQEVFGYSEIIYYQGGDVMQLDHLPSFKNYWDSKGGLEKFHSYVRTQLNLI